MENNEINQNESYVIDELLAVSKVLANKERIKIIFNLMECEEKSVSQLMNELNFKNNSQMSTNLKKLSKCGIVGSRKDGVKIYYHILDTDTREFIYKLKELFE